MRLLVVSDPHYAGRAEQARRGWESRVIRRPWLRLIAAIYRRYFWLADPTAHNGQLDRFIAAAGGADLVVANGDYSCDSAFVGLADDAAFASAKECLGQLRAAFGDRLAVVMGDHELGKMSLFGGVGGPRIASWQRCVGELGIAPVWTKRVGSHLLVGIASSVAALPAFDAEILPQEQNEWERIRATHTTALATALRELGATQRLLLFCHDPTAFPYLAEMPAMAACLDRLDATVIGHLHSELILSASRWLGGMPELSFLGQTVRRLSAALRRSRSWRPFRPVLCPSLAGVQLRKDGGYLELRVGETGRPVEVTRRHLAW